MVIAECLDDLRLPGDVAVQQAIRNKRLRATALGLDIGERTAILVTQNQNAHILIDEKHGREVARRLGLRVICTLGILVVVSRRKLIVKLKPLLIQLKTGGYYVGDDLLNAALELCGESSVT